MRGGGVWDGIWRGGWGDGGVWDRIGGVEGAGDGRERERGKKGPTYRYTS